MVVCFIHVRMEQPVLTYPMATDVTVHQAMTEYSVKMVKQSFFIVTLVLVCLLVFL